MVVNENIPHTSLFFLSVTHVDSKNIKHTSLVNDIISRIEEL